MIGGHHRPNAEILAQGVANIGSALFGGLPATGAIARTATNVRAGGKTPVAGLVHALTILLVMLLAAPLAGLSRDAGARRPADPDRLEHERAAQVARLSAANAGRIRPCCVMTLVLTVFADLTVAIGVGVAVGLALRLQRRNIPPTDWTTPDR